MRRLIQLTIASYLILLSVPVNAVIITETWRSTITSEYNSGFSVGDYFDWTLTYDSDGTRIHNYYDGVNKIAESGSGDDTLESTLCLTASFGPGCDHSLGVYTTASDAVFDISAWYSVLDAVNTEASLDHRIANSSRVYYNDDSFHWYYEADHVEFSDNRAIWIPEDVSTNAITYFTSIRIAATPTPVPIPSTLLLMVSGLAGLGFMSRKKKQT